MSDIRTQLFRPLQPGQPPYFDWLLDGADLDSENGLETAVIISLFTDRRAEPDDTLPHGGDDRGGWWADAYPEIEGDRIGSRLWLLAREKESQAAVNRAREYTEEALAWLVERGVARQVDVLTGWVDRFSGLVTEAKTVNSRRGVLGIAIKVYRPDGSTEQFRFENFWQQMQ